jgi:flagellum-specific ATP synthase
MAELIRIGAYKPGSDAELDRAIRLYPMFETFLTQGKTEKTSLAEGYAAIAQILASP